MSTTLEKLNQINTAITAIEKGAQEYRIGNRTYKRAELSTLYDERRNIQNEINSGYSSYFIKFEGR